MDTFASVKDAIAPCRCSGFFAAVEFVGVQVVFVGWLEGDFVLGVALQIIIQKKI